MLKNTGTGMETWETVITDILLCSGNIKLTALAATFPLRLTILNYFLCWTFLLAIDVILSLDCTKMAKTFFLCNGISGCTCQPS